MTDRKHLMPRACCLLLFTVTMLVQPRVAAGTMAPTLTTASNNFSCPSGNYCGSCNKTHANYDTIHLMIGNTTAGLQQFHRSVREAVDMFRSYPGVRTDDVADAHMTVQYLCCLDGEQLKTVRRVIAGRPFPKLEVRFERVICRTASFIVQADPATQTKLGAWVSAIEKDMIAAGVPVPIRRAEQAPFHSTLCTIGPEYANSSAVALAAVNARFAGSGGAPPTGFNTAPIAIDGAMLLPDMHS